MNAKAKRAKMIEDEKALTQSEAAQILGCQDRELQSIIPPSYFLNGRPRFIFKEVIKIRDGWVKQTQKVRDQTTETLQNG